jgi:RNA polymerase sigma-70 factor, ECF subfamily
MSDSAKSLYWQMLVVRCQVGDALALQELVAACQPKLRGFLFKLLAGRANVDDVAQDVWMDVFRDLPRLAKPAAFLPWFYRIARNRAFRALRHRPIENHVSDETEFPAEEDVADFTPVDVAAVHAAMDQLSPEHREVLLLRFMEEMNYQDISAVVGCNLGTVRSRIHAAKRLLRKIIERQEQLGE